MAQETFGSFVRGHREEKGLGLREMAGMIGVSPTYLSKVERDQFDPPAEDKVIAIAEVLSVDRDELLALAGKVATDVTDAVKRRPKQLSAFLRTTQDMSDDELDKLMKKLRGSRKG